MKVSLIFVDMILVNLLTVIKHAIYKIRNRSPIMGN